MLKILRNSLLIFILLSIEFYQIIDYKVHDYIIDNIYLNDNISNKVDYIGYVEIERLGIKREIVLGINNYNLLTHVTLDESSKNLDSDNIILAGHAIKNIFGNLKNIELNDIIKIKSIDKNNYYKVTSIKIVDKYDKSVIDDSNLILITCVNFKKRLIVKAKRI